MGELKQIFLTINRYCKSYVLFVVALVASVESIVAQALHEKTLYYIVYYSHAYIYICTKRKNEAVTIYFPSQIRLSKVYFIKKKRGGFCTLTFSFYYVDRCLHRSLLRIVTDTSCSMHHREYRFSTRSFQRFLQSWFVCWTIKARLEKTLVWLIFWHVPETFQEWKGKSL